jgi:CubicO group peptidase (beta-lactamase class C family)
MKIRLSFFAIYLFSLSAMVLLGQIPAKDDTGKLLDEYLTRMAGFGYSGAVIVEKNGKIVLKKGYGFANRERKIPFTIDTPTSVASISKQFTAAAILNLEERGKLGLDDPVTNFLENVPEDKKAITIRQLLTHTAGFADNYSATGITDRNEAIKAILRQPLASPVGGKYLYSNDGYELAGAVAEIIAGEDLRTFIRRNLLEPAGMKTAGFAGEVDFWKNREAAHPYNYYIDTGSPVFDQPDWEGRGSGSSRRTRSSRTGGITLSGGS